MHLREVVTGKNGPVRRIEVDDRDSCAVDPSNEPTAHSFCMELVYEYSIGISELEMYIPRGFSRPLETSTSF